MLRKVVALVMFSIAMLPRWLLTLLSPRSFPRRHRKAAAQFLTATRFNEQYDIDLTMMPARASSETDPRDGDCNLRQVAEHGKILDFQRISMSFQGEGKNRRGVPGFTDFVPTCKRRNYVQFPG